MSPNRQKHTQIAAKSQAIRNELARLHGDPDCRPYRGGTYEYDFNPVPVDDSLLSSRLYGPQMKSVQWEPTTTE